MFFVLVILWSKIHVSKLFMKDPPGISLDYLMSLFTKKSN